MTFLAANFGVYFFHDFFWQQIFSSTSFTTFFCIKFWRLFLSRLFLAANFGVYFFHDFFWQQILASISFMTFFGRKYFPFASIFFYLGGGGARTFHRVPPSYILDLIKGMSS